MAKSSAHAEDFFCHFHKSYFPFPPHTNKTASLKLQLSNQLKSGSSRLSPFKCLWSMNRLLGIRLVIFRREKDESIL
ncbi:MAG: hypothetical protein K0S80_993 [Neobacillus sp.]|nr:hypothetical protein [Neobacillus sp.]